MSDDDCMHCEIWRLIAPRLAGKDLPDVLPGAVKDVAQVLAELIALPDDHDVQDALYKEAGEFIKKVVLEEAVVRANPQPPPKPDEDEVPGRLH